jgi:hypothetical protein
MSASTSKAQIDTAWLREQRTADEARRPPQRRPAERLCLSCREPFQSSWIGNRLCRKCAS